ncbi:ABC transporter ATP-binding protein [Streptomycetaceae bacterium NBC_01309]
MLDAVDVVKRFGRTSALDGLSLRVEPGEICGLIGHNGAGKTTFARIVSGLLRPDSGHVRVAGLEPRKARRQLGVAPQHLALYPGATVRENLLLFGGLAGLRRKRLAAAVDDIATALSLDRVLDRRVRHLSGGQQRRTQAGTAMIHRPPLLLLDEPTAGVDPETRQSLLAALRARADEGAAIVYTTHYLPEIMELGASVAVAGRGRVLARGSAADLLAELPGEIRMTLPHREIRVPTRDPGATLAALLAEANGPVLAVDVRRPSLDDLYRVLADGR